jgi:DNA-binding NarL/FixJ family response regulator
VDIFANPPGCRALEENAVPSVSATLGRELSAVVVAGDEEIRVLLRGLLRLHHVRIEGEAEGSTQALELVRELRPSLLVTDVNLAEGSSSTLIAEAKGAVPGLWTVLVAPASRPPPGGASAAGPDAVLLRPFRIRQFVDALGPPSVPG